MKYRLIFFFGLCAAALFSGCDIINPPEDIPAYIRVQDYKIEVDSLNEGTSSSKISDIWVNAGGAFLGAYEMPVTVPILKKGTTRITLTPGIKENGLSTLRSPYPFLEPYEIDLNLQEAKIDTIRPVWKYSNSTEFALIENFEGIEPVIEPTNRNEATITILNDKDSAFEGQGALKATLSGSALTVALQTKDAYKFPTGTAVWLELNYKNTMPFQIGIFSVNPSSGAVREASVAGLNPSAEWNKMYVNLTNSVAVLPNNVIKVYFAYRLSESGTGGTIYLDNIKLLYLE